MVAAEAAKQLAEAAVRKADQEKDQLAKLEQEKTQQEALKLQSDKEAKEKAD